MTQTTTERVQALVDAHCTNDYGRFHPDTVAVLALAAYRMAIEDAQGVCKAIAESPARSTLCAGIAEHCAAAVGALADNLTKE